MQQQLFNPDSSANALGLHTKVGSQISCVPDPVYAAPAHLVRRVCRELDPSFRPLWVNILWRSPNGGLVKTGHHMLARHVLHPLRRAPIVKGLLLPTLPTYGLHWRPPILLATILDGLSDEERNQGVLPRYVPFDEDVVASMRFAMHRRNNVAAKDRADQAEQAETERVRRAEAAIASETAYRKQQESLRIKRHLGLADFVYVTDHKKGAA